MKLFTATIEVLIEADSDAAACDAIAEALRPMLRRYCDSETAWVDWQYDTHPEAISHALARMMFEEFHADCQEQDAIADQIVTEILAEEKGEAL